MLKYKKKNTLLLMFGSLINISILQAAGPWNPKWDTTVIKKKIIYEECLIDSTFKIPAGKNRVIKFDMSTVSKDKNGSYYIVNVETNKPFPDSIILPASDVDSEFSLKFKHKRILPEDEPTQKEGYEGSFELTGSGDIPNFYKRMEYKYYNHPIVTVTDSSITNLDNQKLDIKWHGGYDSVFYSIDNGGTWFLRENETLTNGMIANLSGPFSIVIREPNGCGTITVFKKAPNTSSSPPVKVENTAPVVFTGHDKIFPGKQGLKTKNNFNVEVENNNVWGNNGMLYITSATSGNAKVYNVLGALNRTITFSAGETSSIPLPAGIYVVAMSNGKVYKVAIR